MTSAAQLLDCLRRFRLLEPAQLDELTRQLQGQSLDARALARQLIDRGWLTPYQVNQLFLGRGDGLLLGNYVLLERVGEGGMGAVFKAKNWKLGRVVALKVIKKDCLASPTAVKRFRRETEAAAQLDHPQIVRAFDADEVNGSHFLVMEYVEGTDLARLVKQHGPLPVARACECVRQSALGLQHAHGRGLVHRDLKPSNLLLTGGGQVKVLDMGLARLVQADDSADHSSTLTQEGAMMGTPDFVAPEQTLDAHSADVRSDLYSLGCTLYFLLTGYVPFPGGTLGEKIARHLAREPVPVEQLRREVPPAVAAVVRKLMAKRPDERYQTPAELAAALAPFVAGAAPPPAVMDTVPEGASPWAQLDAPSTTEDGGRPPRRRRSRRACLAAAGALAVLTLAVLVWRPWRGRPAPPAEETVTPRPQPTTPQRQAEEALKPLAARLTEALKDGAPPEHLAELLPQLREFPRQYAGTPAAGQACRLLGRALARSPSPLDALGAAKLPDELRRRWEAAGVKPPVVAVLGEPRRRHGGAVKLLAFTPDGQTVRSVGADRVVGHWGLEKDAHRFVGLPVAPGGFWAPLAVSPDAALLAASVGANAGGGIKLWDLAAGRERVPLEDSLHAFRSGAFTPDGKVLYAIAYHTEGHSKTALWSWDVATGKKKAVYPFPIAWPDDHPFALSPDGKALALGYKASRTDTEITVAVKLWEPDTGKERSLFKGPGAQFLAVAFSPDGRTVAAKRYGDGAAILAWDAATGKESFTLPGEHPLAFSPDGKLLATGDGRLLDAASGKVRFTLPPGGVPAFAPDGKSLAYGGADGGVRLWDVATGKELRPLPGPTGPALRVALAPDGRTAAAGYRDGVRVWDVLSGRELRFRPGGRANFPALEFGPDGKTLAVAICNPQGVAFLNLATGEETRAARDPGYVYGGALSPDGKVFVTAQSGGLDLWAVADGKHQRNVSGPFAISAAFSPDGRVLAVGCHPRGARLYEAATGRPLGALENVEQAMPGVIYAPHGQALAGRDYDGKVALWDLRSKKKQHDVGTAARGPAFSPDGRLLATWGDGGVTLWDGHTGRKVREFVAPGPVHDLAFAADGRHLATANANGTVSVWRLPLEMGP